ITSTRPAALARVCCSTPPTPPSTSTTWARTGKRFPSRRHFGFRRLPLGREGGGGDDSSSACLRRRAKIPIEPRKRGLPCLGRLLRLTEVEQAPCVGHQQSLRCVA